MSAENTEETIAEVETALGCVLPEALRGQYVAPSEAPGPDDWVPLRLMSFGEVAAFHAIVEVNGWAAHGLRVFWTDDQSNYAGLYLAGPLAGKVCFVSHDETDLSPVYASLASFLNAMQDARPQGLDWFRFRRDYPALGPSGDPASAARDREIAESFQPLYEAAEDDERVYYAFCRMALTPFEDTDTLLAMTRDEDDYIQERACQILGLRRSAPAIDRLAEVARDGRHNSRMAAIRALGRIGTPAARSRLEELRSLLPEGYHAYIPAA